MQAGPGGEHRREQVTVEISLEGKVALVTGVGPNIGSGIALALARYGAKVACNDVSEEVIKKAIARIERNGGEAMPAPGDVTDEEAVKGYIQDILDRWGRLDIVVNNAALLGGRGVLDESAETFEKMVKVSALGTFLNTKYGGRAMAERGIKGSIICVSSSNGWNGSAGVIAYAFHKGGVNNFVRAAAMDLAPYGIRVNSITPTAPNPDNPELLAERARQGLSLGGVLTPTGVGTVVAEGKRVIELDGREYLLEPPLRADFALIRAHEADYFFNLTYRLAAANFNPVMALAAECVIAEPDEIVPLGAIPPDAVRTSGALVHHLVERRH